MARVDHVTILARSMSESMAFYGALLPLLGFTSPKPHIWDDGQGFFIQFLPARPDTRDYERYAPGLNHIGFGVDSPDQVEAIRAAMQAAGFDTPDIQNLGGATALFMKDPDGLRFEITHYPPGVSVVG